MKTLLALILLCPLLASAQQTIWFPNTGNSVDTAAVLKSVRDAIAALPIDSSTTGRILMKSSTGSGAIVNGPEFPLDNTTTNHLAKKHSDGSIVDGPRYNGTSSDTVLTADEVREQIEVYGYGTGSGTGDLDTLVSDQFSTTATRDTVVIANINSTCTIFGLTARMTAATDTALAADSRLMAWAESGRAIISRGSGGTSGLKYSFAWRWAAPGIVFKPDSLGGLLGWWAGRFYTGSDNDSVATWKNHTADSVTTAWNLTLTPRDNYVPRYAMKPIFKTNVINSLPVVRFTRNDTTSLTCDSLGGRFAGIDRPFTVVMVGKVHTLIVGQPIWSFSKAAVDSFQTHYGYVDSSASDERRMGQYRRNSLDQQQYSSNSVIPSQANNLTSPWVAVWSFDGDSVWTQFNGGERFILEPVVFKTWAGMGSFTLGQQYSAGENDPAHFSNVDVAELLVYNKELSSAELTYLYAQLKSIYNTP